jgi:hypothetical protein
MTSGRSRMRKYHYIGPEEIGARAAAMPPGVRITTLAELVR